MEVKILSASHKKNRSVTKINESGGNSRNLLAGIRLLARLLTAPIFFAQAHRTEKGSAMPLPTDKTRLDLSQHLLEAFDNVNGGVHSGSRPAHAKGVMLTGVLRPTLEAAKLTRAPHMQRETPVTVRFSDFAGIPNIPDNHQEASPRGCAIRFHLGEHTHTDIVSHSIDDFPARTAEEFGQFLAAVAATRP